MIIKLHEDGQTIRVEFAEGHSKPVIVNNTFRVEFVNITHYEWLTDELRLHAPKDTIAIPRSSVAYIIIVVPPNKE